MIKSFVPSLSDMASGFPDKFGRNMTEKEAEKLNESRNVAEEIVEYFTKEIHDSIEREYGVCIWEEEDVIEINVEYFFEKIYIQFEGQVLKEKIPLISMNELDCKGIVIGRHDVGNYKYPYSVMCKMKDDRLIEIDASKGVHFSF